MIGDKKRVDLRACPLRWRAGAPSRCPHIIDAGIQPLFRQHTAERGRFPAAGSRRAATAGGRAGRDRGRGGERGATARGSLTPSTDQRYPPLIPRRPLLTRHDSVACLKLLAGRLGWSPRDGTCSGLFPIQPFRVAASQDLAAESVSVSETPAGAGQDTPITQEVDMSHGLQSLALSSSITARCAPRILRHRGDCLHRVN